VVARASPSRSSVARGPGAYRLRISVNAFADEYVIPVTEGSDVTSLRGRGGESAHGGLGPAGVDARMSESR
jgi:hypothetical protein